MVDAAEKKRLDEAAQDGAAWKKWGPYLSERQWGTVREDYSDNGDAWNYFTHDQARSRAYRWGEDGLAGISDDHQVLCFALALWNGRDPILKERAFGLANSEGNHGEDVKEYYFYLDSTPTHSYMKYLYKYPQAAYPVRRPRHDQPQPRQARARVRAARHRRVRRQPLLRRLRRIRQGGARRRAGPDQRLQPRPGRGAAARAADAVVSQHLVAGRAAARSRSLERIDLPRPCGGARPSQRPAVPGIAARLLPLLRRRRAAAVHRERDQQRAALRLGECLALREGRHQQLRRARRRRGGESGAAWAPRSRRTTQLDVGAGADAGHPAAADDARAGRVGAALRRLRRGVRGAPERGRRVLRRRSRRPRCAGSRPRQRHAPGAGGHAVDQAVLLLRPRPVARRARRRRPPAAARAPAGAQQRVVRTCSTTTSSRCRTSGSTPGTPRGTWRST